MEYYFKFNKELKSLLFLHLFWLLSCALHVIKSNDSDKSSFYLYFGILWSIFTISSIVRNYNLIKLTLKRRPLLAVDAVGIVDHVNGIKYNWDDIKEVIEEGKVLYIQVTNVEKYLRLFKNRYSRYLHYSKLENHFKLSLDCISTNTEALIETLTDYSILSQQVNNK